jgi:calcineurin-like phosphoesterase family protein
MRWYTSDHHFFHKNIIKYCERPFKDIDEMNLQLILRWNHVIDPKDEVFILGDWSFEGGLWLNQQILKTLKGKKTLIRGNHDPKIEKCKSWGFDVVEQRLEHDIAGERVVLSHYPYEPDATERELGYDIRFVDRRPRDTGKWLLHGHVHQHWKTKKKMINVGVDVWNFYPASEPEIAAIIGSAQKS